MHPSTSKLHQEGVSQGVKTMPRRSLPPEFNGQPITSPFKEGIHQTKFSLSSGKASMGDAQIGSFWSTQNAHGSQGSQGSLIIQDKSPPMDQQHEIIVPKVETKHTSQTINTLNTESKPALQNKYFVAPLATLDTNPQNTGNNNRILGENNSAKEERISQVNNLKDLIKQANLEKAEIASKYEKLAVICQSQRQEIHELKLALAAVTTSPPSKESSKDQNSPAGLKTTSLQKDKFDPNLLELEQAILANTNSVTELAAPSQFTPWQTFNEEPKPKPFSNSSSGLSRPSNGEFKQHNYVSAQISYQKPGTAAPAWGGSSQRFGGALEKNFSANQLSNWTSF